MNRSNTRRALICAFLSVTVAIPALASARPPTADGGEAGSSDDAKQHKQHSKDHKARRAKFMAKMKVRRGKILREKVGLPEARAKRIESMMDGFHTQMRAVKKQMRVQHLALRKLLKQDSADEAAYKTALDSIVASKQQIDRLKAANIDAIRKQLSYKEQAKAMMALHHMKRGMHRFMGRHHGGPKGKRGGRMGHGRAGGDARHGPPPGPAFDSDDGDDEPPMTDD